jgi:3-phosphoshikimate 1-carboxyvinyltransferase
MTVMHFSKSGPLRGTLRPPGDKSISHRALILGAVANGVSRIRGLSNGEDVARTADAMRAVGIDISGGDEMIVKGGKSLIQSPAASIYLGNSGTSTRLLCGLIAGLGLNATFTGDESLTRRPMARVVEPLRQMGAVIDGEEGGNKLPLTIKSSALHGIDFTPPVKSAQVKAAVLLAGLNANGVTVVREPVQTRSHTEEMLAEFGADISTDEALDGTWTVTLKPSEIEAFELDVASDPSQAAFWMVAAAIVPNSDVTLENVYVGPGRGGMIDVLARMGADVDVDYRSAVTADIRVRHSRLYGTDVGEDEVPSMIDELPVLAIAAAVAEGTTRVTDAAELRVKESDRIAAVVNEIGGLGVEVHEQPDGFVIEGNGGKLLDGGSVRAKLDHRIAMTGAVAGLASSSQVSIEGWESVATSYPAFREDLERLKA